VKKGKCHQSVTSTRLQLPREVDPKPEVMSDFHRQLPCTVWLDLVGPLRYPSRFVTSCSHEERKLAG